MTFIDVTSQYRAILWQDGEPIYVDDIWKGNAKYRIKDGTYYGYCFHGYDKYFQTSACMGERGIQLYTSFYKTAETLPDDFKAWLLINDLL